MWLVMKVWIISLYLGVGLPDTTDTLVYDKDCNMCPHPSPLIKETGSKLSAWASPVQSKHLFTQTSSAARQWRDLLCLFRAFLPGMCAGGWALGPCCLCEYSAIFFRSCFFRLVMRLSMECHSLNTGSMSYLAGVEICKDQVLWWPAEWLR